MSDRVKIEEKKVAFQNRLQTFSIINIDHTDMQEFLNDAFQFFASRVSSALEKYCIVKVSANFIARFEKPILTGDNETKESQKMYLNTMTEIVDIETNLREFYDEDIMSVINKKIDDVQLRGSGFSLAEILELNIQISSFDPTSGSSYIKLPKYLQNKKAIINVQNKDNECFRYAILSALYPVTKNAQRVSNYRRYKNILNFNGIKFPVCLKQITKFELQNPTISINVYMFCENTKKIRPLRLTKQVKEKHIHLLMITEMNDKYDIDRKAHYCWIKDLSALFGDQVSKHCGKKLFCDRCLNHFWLESKMKKHNVYCLRQNECQIIMPTFDEDILEFKNYKKQLMVPFIVYADVESILKIPEIKFCKSESTQAYQQHEVHSIGYYFKCLHDDSLSYYNCRRGPDCVEWFVQELHQVAQKVERILSNPIPLSMSLEDEVLFIISEECHICGETFCDGIPRVRDHSHITGEFRGAAHEECNLIYQEARHVPVVFHNLSNYDAHFIIKAIANNIPGEIKIIPCNDQKYISFTKIIPSSSDEKFEKFIHLRFIDSFRFMASSLDYLSSLLPSEEKKNLRSECMALPEAKVKLLERKGVFCYDYVDSWEKLNESMLPPKNKFYSMLCETDVSDDDYNFAIKVWNEFNIKTLGEYSDLYMKTDILLLADVFEHFRRTCYNIYKLDPAHYYTAPGLSFDAMLKYTQVKIELFTDVDMLLFIERGIRGGISQCSKRYSKANNKYMKDYDPNKESIYLMYLDANNLYGYSMMENLPIDEFTWCYDAFTTDQIMNLSDESPIGYIFEVDLEYPKTLHDIHKDYPFCPENRLVPNTKEKKLLLTLFEKKNYVVHYRMLKSALREGMVLKNVHKVLQFKQSRWLKPYIELNTMLRTKATNEFEKNFYKLLINAIYGKTMENMRSRVDIKLRTSWDGQWGVRNLIAKPNFKHHTIFDENLVAVHLHHTHIVMNKPIAIGMSILDLSKVLMYDFYYDQLKAAYGENIQMIYTDTDSFILEIKTDCFYSDMLQNLDKYDTSDYSEDNIFKIPRVNKKVPGLFKDELNGKVMTEFVGLRSKMYCVKAEGVEKMKKAKGVKKYVLKKTITFDHYMDCIQNKCVVVRDQNTIRSKKHEVFTIKQTKIALSSADNKRYILNGNINTLPWGHYNVPE